MYLLLNLKHSRKPTLPLHQGPARCESPRALPARGRRPRRWRPRCTCPPQHSSLKSWRFHRPAPCASTALALTVPSPLPAQSLAPLRPSAWPPCCRSAAREHGRLRRPQSRPLLPQGAARSHRGDARWRYHLSALEPHHGLPLHHLLLLSIFT